MAHSWPLSQRQISDGTELNVLKLLSIYHYTQAIQKDKLATSTFFLMTGPSVFSHLYEITDWIVLQLVRRLLHSALELLQRHAWDIQLVSRVVTSLDEHIVKPRRGASEDPLQLHDGLRYHLADILLDELTATGHEDVRSFRLLLQQLLLCLFLVRWVFLVYVCWPVTCCSRLNTLQCTLYEYTCSPLQLPWSVLWQFLAPHAQLLATSTK